VSKAFSFGWAVFAAASTILPDVVALLHKLLPGIELFGFTQWIITHQVWARLIAAGMAVSIYLVYSPYRIFKEQEERFKAITTENYAKQERSDVRTKLTAYLIELEQRIAALKRMEPLDVVMFDKTPTATEPNHDLVREISAFIKKHVGVSYAGEFLSNTGLTPLSYAQRSASSSHLEYLTWRASRLKHIIEGYKLD